MEIRPLITSWLCYLLLAGNSFLYGSEPERPLISVALPLAGETPGSYLFLESEEAGEDAVYQVFRKDGAANASNPFKLVGQIRPQTDPRTVQALLIRGEALFGDDLIALDNTLNNFLQALADDPSVAEISSSEKLATLIEFSKTDKEIKDNLRILAKRFKGVGLCSGIAYAEACSGIFTYELRRASFPNEDPLKSNVVVARLTLDTSASSSLLPAPVSLQAIPMTDSRGHAVVRLRWATTDALDEQGPIRFGYRVFRDGEAISEQPILPQEELTVSEASIQKIEAAIEDRFTTPSGWNTTTMAADLLTNPEYSFPSSAAARTTARELRIASQIYLEDLQSDFHFIDDGGLSRGDGTTLTPGSTHSYTVAALDVLGRAGTMSESIEVTISNLEPPQLPKNVKVANIYSYDTATETSNQQLKISWPVPRDENGDVIENISYLIYRWNSATEYIRYRDYPWGHGDSELDLNYSGRQLPSIGLVAMPSEVFLNASGNYYEWVDPVIDSEFYSLQVFYTIQAVVDSGNGFPVLSGHSAPTMGVLRDRQGPDTANILKADLPCPVIGITCAELDANTYANELGYIDVSAQITDPQEFSFIKAAVFYAEGMPNEPIAYTEFDSLGIASARLQIDPSRTSDLNISCRVMLNNGYWSEEHMCVVTNQNEKFPKNLLFYVDFLGYDAELGNCGSVYWPYQVDGSEVDPSFEVIPAEDTYAYSFYRRVNNGELELIQNLEFEKMLSFENARTLTDDAPPNFFKRLCYYYQGRDEHGNPGPLQLINCFLSGMPITAMPQPEVISVSRAEGSSENEPGLSLEFFCPPEGVQTFIIEVRCPSADAPFNLANYDESNRQLSSRVVERTYTGTSGHRYAAYSTVATSVLEADSGVFKIDFRNIDKDVNYAFRVIACGPAYPDANSPVGRSGLLHRAESSPSEEITGNWLGLAPATSDAEPTVKWPARAQIPPVSIENSPHLKPTGPISAQFLNKLDTNGSVIWKGVGVQVGQFDLTSTTDYNEEKIIENDTIGPEKFSLKRYKLTNRILMNQPNDWQKYLYDITIPGPLSNSEPVERTLLPCILYRMLVDSEGNALSKDLTQCSPQMSSNTLAIEINDTNAPKSITLKDPFLIFGELQPSGSNYSLPLYIKDNQPVIRGEYYRYYLVLNDARGEIANILDLGLVQIP